MKKIILLITILNLLGCSSEPKKNESTTKSFVSKSSITKNEKNDNNVYLQINKTKENSPVSFYYDDNKEGNRPSLSIQFLDGFELFKYVSPVCEGEYCWCLRDENNEDITYLKITIEGDKLISSYKLDEKIQFHNKKENIIKHVELLGGIFIK